MKSKQEILSFLKSRKDFLRKNFYVTRIGLFGSFADETATEKSDVDLLVEFENSEKLNIYDIKRRLREFLESELKRNVDLANPKYLKPFYKEQILTKALYA